MTIAVLDASVVLKWFGDEDKRHPDPARALRLAFAAGELVVLAPPLLFLEIINVAGRRWRWTDQALRELAHALDQLGFEVQEPDIERVAFWVGRGLTAYDAAYVTVAETQGVPLVTDDRLILQTAAGIALPPGAIVH